MITLIGDIHGNTSAYLDIIANTNYSVQLGDFGFHYSRLDVVNANHHKIIPGNHDNYNRIGDYPYHIFQNDYGIFELNGIRFGYIRGAYSIDKVYRIPNVSWWANEEISYKSGIACINFFQYYQPNIILSHDCPFSIVPLIATNNWKLNSSRTGQLLDEVLKVAKPKCWYFGHHHQTKIVDYCGTRFVCVGEHDFVNI